MPVEILVKADFIADLGGIEVDPGFGHVGFHFAQKVIVNGIVEGYILRITQVRFGFIFQVFTRLIAARRSGQVLAKVG